MIIKHRFYVNRWSVGPYQAYLALEDAQNKESLVKMVELTTNKITYRDSNSVNEIPAEWIDKEYVNIAQKYM